MKNVRRIVSLSVLLICGVTSFMAAETRSCALTRQEWIDALRKEKVLDPARLLVHLSHTCDLDVDGAPLHVLDVRELVPGTMLPRGVNQMVVLDDKNHVRQTIGYTDGRPLYCEKNELYLYAPVAIANSGPEGDVLVFSQRGAKVRAEARRWVERPPYTFPKGK